MSTDGELLQRYAEGKSQVAFAELVERHIALVYSAALRHVGGDAHLAKDVTQTVFTALARKASSLAGRAAVAGWLYLSAHHAAAQAVRSDRRRKVREEEAHAMHELHSNEAATDWGQVRPVLDDAMRALSDIDREAVLLRFFEHRPFSEIGAALRTTDDAARMRVERALEKLRVLLGRRGITSTSAALGAALGAHAVTATPAGLATSVASAAMAGAAAKSAVMGAGVFMNSTLIVSSAVAVALVASGLAWHQNRQAARAEAAVAAATHDSAALQAQLRDAQQRAALAEQQGAALQRELEAARVFNTKLTSTTAPAPSPAAAPRTTGGMVTWTLAGPDGVVRDSLSYPDTSEGRRTAMGQAVESGYAAFFRQQGFTAAQREQFKDLMHERKERGNELFRAAHASGTKTDGNLARTISDQTSADFHAKLSAAFGEGIVDALKRYEDTRPIRSAMVDKLAAALFYSDTPLTAAQADQLVDVIANHARTPQGRVNLGALKSDAMLVHAQGLLSLPQLERLREIDAQRQLDEKAWAQRRQSAGTDAAPKKPGS